MASYASPFGSSHANLMQDRTPGLLTSVLCVYMYVYIYIYIHIGVCMCLCLYLHVSLLVYVRSSFIYVVHLFN